jgi:hypothetical protein
MRRFGLLPAAVILVGFSIRVGIVVSSRFGRAIQ